MRIIDRDISMVRISSPADVRPGISISLPVQQVRAADSALLESLQAIQSATAEGAQVFAPREIGDAIESRDNAIAQREVGGNYSPPLARFVDL